MKKQFWQKSKVSFFLLMITLLSSCSSKSPQNAPPMAPQQNGFDVTLQNAEWALRTGESENKYENADSLTKSYDAAASQSVSGAETLASNNPNQKERKIIKTGYFRMETLTFDETTQVMQNVVLEKGGYVEQASSQLYDWQQNLKQGNFVFRIPQEHFETTKAQLETMGQVLSSSSGQKDESETFYNLESRKKLKEAEEERVLEMIQKAQTVDDLIVLEQHLSAIRTEIENYKTRLTTIDRLASFSTLTVELLQVKDLTILPTEKVSFGQKVINSFIDSWHMLIDFLKGAVLVLVALSVPTFFLLVVAFVGYQLWRLFKPQTNKNANQRSDSGN